MIALCLIFQFMYIQSQLFMCTIIRHQNRSGLRLIDNWILIMVMHNNELLSFQLRKHWGKFVWTLFGQPARKHKIYFARNWTAKKVYPSPNSKHGLGWKWSWKFQSFVRNIYLISMLLESFITLNIWIIKKIIFIFILSSCKSESPWYV